MSSSRWNDDSLSSHPPGRVSECGDSVLKMSTHEEALDRMSLQRPWNTDPSSCSSMTALNHVFSATSSSCSDSGKGDSLMTEMSGTDPTRNICHSWADTALDDRSMLTAIVKEYSSLSFSNRPLHTLV